MALVFVKTADNICPLWIEQGQIINPENLPDEVEIEFLMTKLTAMTVPTLVRFLDDCGLNLINKKQWAKKDILSFIRERWGEILQNARLLAHPIVLRRVAEEVGAHVDTAGSASATADLPLVKVFEGEGYKLNEPDAKLSNPVEHLTWTADDERRLAVLWKLNSNPMGFNVDSDKLAELIEKKGKVQLSLLPSSMVNGSTTVSGGKEDGDKTVVITIATVNGTMKMNYRYTSGTSGDDVFKFLGTVLFDVDLSLFRLKVSNAPSYIQKFDSIANYLDENSSLELIPAMSGGGKATVVKKKIEKASGLKSKLDEKAKVANDHTLPDVAVMEHKISMFIQDIDTGASNAIEKLIEQLDAKTLQDISEYLDSNSAVSDVKLKGIASLIFGDPMKQIVIVNQTCHHIQESCAVCLNYAFTKASADDTAYTMKSLRGVVEKHLNQKIGAQSALVDMQL